MATQKPRSKISEEILAQYDEIISAVPGLGRKGATMPYTSVNGHMFSFLATDGSMGLRLQAKAREEFIRTHKTKLCEAYGTVLKEYVEVPETLFKHTARLKKYFIQSFEYASSLKPKPTTKPSKGTAAKKTKQK